LLLIAGIAAPARGQSLRQKINIGRRLEQQGDNAAAEELYRDLYFRERGNHTVFLLLKNVYIKQNKYDEALALVEARLKKKPHDAVLQVDRGQLLYQSGKREEAFKQWDTILASGSHNQAVYLRLANALLQEKLIEKAIKVFSRGRGIIKKPDVFAFNLANIYAGRYEFKAATRELLRYLAAHPRQDKIIESQLLRYLKSASRVEDITRTLKKEAERKNANPIFYKVLSSLYLAGDLEGAALKAARLWDDSLPENKNGTGLYQFSKRALTSGQASLALETSSLILKNYPDFRSKGGLLLHRATCFEALQKFGEATEDYVKIITDFPTNPNRKEAMLHLARLQHEQLWRLQLAEKTCRNLIDDYPQSGAALQARLRLGSLLLAEGRAANAATAFSELKNLRRSNPNAAWVEALVQEARSYFLQLKFAEAEKTLAELSRGELGTAALYAPALNNGLELKLFITTFRQSSPKGLAAFAMADLQAEQRKYKQAVDSLNAYLAINEDEKIKPEILRFKAGLLIKAGEEKAALKVFAKAIDEGAEKGCLGDLLWEAAELARHLHKNDLALLYYERILTDLPGSIYTDRVRQELRKLEDRK